MSLIVKRLWSYPKSLLLVLVLLLTTCRCTKSQETGSNSGKTGSSGESLYKNCPLPEDVERGINKQACNANPDCNSPDQCCRGLGVETYCATPTMCTYHGKMYSNGEKWVNTAESLSCECSSGKVLCRRSGECGKEFNVTSTILDCQLAIQCQENMDHLCPNNSKCCAANFCGFQEACAVRPESMCASGVEGGRPPLLDGQQASSPYLNLDSTCQHCTCSGMTFTRTGGCSEPCLPGLCYVTDTLVLKVNATAPDILKNATGKYTCSCRERSSGRLSLKCGLSKKAESRSKTVPVRVANCFVVIGLAAAAIMF